MKNLYFTVIFSLFTWLGIFGQTYFPPLEGDEWETVGFDELSWCDDAADTLLSFLEARDSRSFIILVDGKIAIESYFNGHGQNSLWYWASAGKVLAATLTGIAQEEGFLSIDDPVSQYLGEGWATCDPEEEITRTIWHQLTMTSTFDNSPLLGDCTTPDCFVCDGDVGTEWHYHNGVYRRLHDVLDSATGIGMNPYTDTRIEDKIGMTGFWTADELYISRTRDMARFGLLAESNFVWDGDVVLGDQEYITAMTTPSQSLNESYGYLWWLNGQDSYRLPYNPFLQLGNIVPAAPADMYAGLGANDQKVYVVPSLNMVVVRMGESADESTPSLSSFDNDLWELIMALPCTISSTDNLNAGRNTLVIYPNPAQGTFYLKDAENFVAVEVYDCVGKHISSFDSREMKGGISVAPGAYVVRAYALDGGVHTGRAIVQ